ncbi:hypothetical protein JXB22_02875 [candidate division WOR-3 bacterium]|nr:hypothetical protein [candidate division WOR-3 bacterium]
MSRNVSLAILWHFHQPVYSKPDDCTLPLPWVRLHCIKDYLDMLRHVQKFPDMRVTFNFTPSLLLQIDAYKNRSCTDKQFLLFKKPAASLTIEEKRDILRDFFLAHWERMIKPNKRYMSLLLKRGKNIVEGELDRIAQTFTEQEFRDLQIWANLVWIDPLFRHDIEDLFTRGKNFTEADKDRVIQVQTNIINALIDEYKKAQKSGQIEISISPLYHPIVPLLINSDLAKTSNPNLSIPFVFQHPEDARAQIMKGVEIYEQHFECKPRGMWPSEGSVCQEMIPMLRDAGIEWIATDEEILGRSIDFSLRRDEKGVPNRADLLYKPWKDNDIHVLFRDHVLSDRIAFVYNQWDQKKATEDFIEKIQHIKSSLPAFDQFIIPVILDGENAWESFDNDGTVFLESLYEGLSTHGIKTTTISGFLAEHQTNATLQNLFPGSWIGANFNIWIGHTEDHAAWKIVHDLREILVRRNIDDPAIWDRLYILEGSDWYWWFGEEHFSAVAEVFDELFRLNAIWIYKKIGEEPPPELFSTIKRFTDTVIVQPNDKMTPDLDGEVTYFYEWYHAGHADVLRMGGTMHRFAGLFSAIYCGFDNDHVYIRFDVENHDITAYDYTLKFYAPREVQIPLSECKDVQCVIKHIGEVAVPLSMLRADSEITSIEFVINACQKGKEIDRTPLLKFTVRLEDVKLYNWSI